mmetsp:Transcript_4489/g.14090  ORF Transcript_4489/g.14090 Transcript_4489/m.14090 type:complete len:211 (-) Transcript_4489:138-770(-)
MGICGARGCRSAAGPEARPPRAHPLPKEAPQLRAGRAPLSGMGRGGRRVHATRRPRPLPCAWHRKEYLGSVQCLVRSHLWRVRPPGSHLPAHRVAGDADGKTLVDRQYRADLREARPLDDPQLLLVIVGETGRVEWQGLAVGFAAQVAGLGEGDHKAPRGQVLPQPGVVDLASIVEAVRVHDEREPFAWGPEGCEHVNALRSRVEARVVV